MFGDNLKKARKNRDLTLEQLADMYNKTFNGGLSKGTLSKYENNKQEPMITVVKNLAHILNISTDCLIEDSQDVLTLNNRVIVDNNTPQTFLKYNKLNSLGKQRADEYINDLLENPKYTKPTLADYGEIAAEGGELTTSRKIRRPQTTL